MDDFHAAQKSIKDCCMHTPGAELSRVQGASLMHKGSALTVRDLEQALLRMFPKADALSWDHTGLCAGDPAAHVKKVAVCLDPGASALLQAKRAHANVLLSHHPVFLDPPQNFQPAAFSAAGPGSVVYGAIDAGIALMNFHTALDVNPRAQKVLPSMLRLQFKHVLSPIDESGEKGFGQFCETVEGKPITLSTLAARCVATFHRQPRVWGNFDRPVRHVVTATGSASGLYSEALAHGADCLIAGEFKYHDALLAAASGLCLIELGHDVSELPLVDVLIQSLADIGLSNDQIIRINEYNNWTTPESRRV